MVSVFDIFKIGLGPSSSHTVGPMQAAYQFSRCVLNKGINFSHITVEVYGSLAFTGKGHGTPGAIFMGLMGRQPHLIDPSTIQPAIQQLSDTHQLNISDDKIINFNPDLHLIYNFHDQMDKHSNAMRFKAFNEGDLLYEELIYSVGGGFIIKDSEEEVVTDYDFDPPYPFESAHILLDHCHQHKMSIAEIVLANEKILSPDIDIEKQLLTIYQVMVDSIQQGCQTEGILPGGLNVHRRAYDLHKKLLSKGIPSSHKYSDCMSWLNLFAIAVNEENAAGGRIVTAPTNGAAGIMPAVLHYYDQFCPESTPGKVVEFMLTAAAIAMLFKKNASLSGAEVGCQGEVGVACSMAAAGLTAVLGGTAWQIENAAEIGIEHHLGMTCDPIGGLVQIPCIERNAMGAVKAVNAANLALDGDGYHKVSLDKAILTMKKTGEDMNNIYKETSLGGLAAAHPEC